MSISAAASLARVVFMSFRGSNDPFPPPWYAAAYASSWISSKLNWGDFSRRVGAICGMDENMAMIGGAIAALSISCSLCYVIELRYRDTGMILDTVVVVSISIVSLGIAAWARSRRFPRNGAKQTE